MLNRFGHRESYYQHLEEFQCDKETWENLRPLTFSLTLLGLLFFSTTEGTCQLQYTTTHLGHIPREFEGHSCVDVVGRDV